MRELKINLGSMLETFYNMVPDMTEGILEVKSEPMEESIIYKDGEEW